MGADREEDKDGKNAPDELPEKLERRALSAKEERGAASVLSTSRVRRLGLVEEAISATIGWHTGQTLGADLVPAAQSNRPQRGSSHRAQADGAVFGRHFDRMTVDRLQ